MKTPRPIPWLNLLLLLLAATVSMATLAGEGGDNHGGAEAGVGWLSWQDQHRQRLTVTVNPVEDRLDPLDHEGPIFVVLTLNRVTPSLAESPRWALSIQLPEGGLWAESGSFADNGGEVEMEDSGHSTGELSAQVGRLCEENETGDDGCIPCQITTGCALTVEVDYCYAVGDHTVKASFSLVDSSSKPLALECLEGADSEPCNRLRDWIDAVGESSEPGLCPTE